MSISKPTFTILFIATSILLSITIITNSISSTSSVFAQEYENKYIASLSGENEVPSVKTSASGEIWLKIKLAEDNILYNLNVTNIQKVTAAHIHSGTQGENGPIVVTLFKSDTPTQSINGVLAKGNITSSILEGPLSGKTLSDLISLIHNGEAYVNVHTEQYPNGEIRGQLSNENPQYGTRSIE
jgi:hypothetical protein